MPVQRIRSRVELLNILPKESVVCELGVQYGNFSQRILELVRPRELHLVDCWSHRTDDPGYLQDGANASDINQDKIYRGVQHRFKPWIDSGVVRLHRKMTTDAVQEFPDGYFDWIYVDAAHTYESVIADLLAYESKVKPGGAILGHDYVDRPDRGFGVIKAVTEFCTRGWELQVLTQCSFPSYLLRRV